MAGRKTDEDIEATVRSFLKKIGMEYRVMPDLLTIITKVKNIDPGFNYRRVPDREMPDAEARWLSDVRIIEMRESVFQAMQGQQARARMTIAHELAHYIHNHQGVLNRSVQRTIAELAVSDIRHQESEARRTAAVLLAPEHLIPDGADIETIMKVFALSREAASYRKEEIEAIRRRRRGELRPLPSSIVEFLKEAKRRGINIQTRLDD